MNRPFAGLLDPVLVWAPVPFDFPGAIPISHARAIWIWVYRDLCPDIIPASALANGSLTAALLESVVPTIVERLHAALERGVADPEQDLRMQAVLGSQEAREMVPRLICALDSHSRFAEAQAFGRMLNTISDKDTIIATLRSMSLDDPGLTALLFQATMGLVLDPSCIVGAMIHLAGGPTEAEVSSVGFAPMVDAILAQAQNQLHLIRPAGTFVDMDLICRSLERFHRLVRALTGHVEFARGSFWSTALSGMTRQVSARIEPRLRAVAADVNQALRKGSGAIDRLDDDRILAAINGVYLLATIRECRDSLALNAVFDQVWGQVGQTLEIYFRYNLDLLRQDLCNDIAGMRIDAGIQMARVRFGAEYVATLERARAAVEQCG